MTRQRLEQQSRSSHSTGYSPKQQTTPNAVDGSDNLQYGSSHLSYRQQQLLVEHQKYSAAPNVNYPRQPYVDSLTSHHRSENTDSLSSILDQQRGNRHEVPVGLLSVSRSPSNENSFYRNAEQDPVYVPTMDRRSTLARSSSTSILPPHMSGMLNRLDIRESSKMQNSRSPSGYTGIPPLSPTTNEGSPTGMAQIISSSSIGKLPTNLGSPTSFYGPKVVQHTTPKGSASALPNVYQPQINCYPDADNMVRLNDDTNDMFSIGSQDSHPHKYSIPYGNFSDNISINSADTRYSASYASPGPMEKHLDQLRREQANPSPKLLSKKGMFPLVRSKTMGAGIVILEDEPPIQRQFNPFTSLSPLRGHHNGGRAVFFDESDASSTVAQPPLGDANEGYPLNSFCQAHVDNSDLHSEAFSVQAEADAHSVHDDSDDIDDLLYQTITY